MLSDKCVCISAKFNPTLRSASQFSVTRCICHCHHILCRSMIWQNCQIQDGWMATLSQLKKISAQSVRLIIKKNAVGKTALSLPTFLFLTLSYPVFSMEDTPAKLSTTFQKPGLEQIWIITIQKSNTGLSYKKPSSRPNTKSFSPHLRSQKFFNVTH